MDTPAIPPQLAAPDLPLSKTSRVHAVSRELEAAFLTQMLTLAGVGKAPTGFDGGVGENQFSSFLVSEYAERISLAGGLGLAEHIYNSIVAAEESSG